MLTNEVFLSLAQFDTLKFKTLPTDSTFSCIFHVSFTILQVEYSYWAGFYEALPILFLVKGGKQCNGRLQPIKGCANRRPFGVCSTNSLFCENFQLNFLVFPQLGHYNV